MVMVAVCHLKPQCPRNQSLPYQHLLGRDPTKTAQKGQLALVHNQCMDSKQAATEAPAKTNRTAAMVIIGRIFPC